MIKGFIAFKSHNERIIRKIKVGLKSIDRNAGFVKLLKVKTNRDIGMS